MSTPSLSNARVLSVDVPSRRLTVSLPSTQIVVVQMGIHGPADGLRVSHPAMPGRGTFGLVAFPAGDNRNGIWICSIYSSQLDALTSDNDQFLEYNSHWSGHFDMLDQFGNYTQSFADGSYIQVGSGTTRPDTFRHTVDPQQNQQLTPLTQAERVPNPPPAFHATLNHSSGTIIAVDPQGNTTATGAPNATLTVSFGGSTLLMDASGNTTLTTGTFKVNGAVVATGDVTAGSGARNISLLNHQHGTGTAAAGTSIPTTGT